MVTVVEQLNESKNLANCEKKVGRLRRKKTGFRWQKVVLFWLFSSLNLS